MKAFSGGRAGLAIAASAALSLGVAACASDLGQEWQAITAAESKIALTAPGLEDQRARYMRGRAEGESYSMDLAIWSGAAARHPKAAVAYFKLSAGRQFSRHKDARNHIERTESFGDMNLDFGGPERDTNPQGVIEFRRFRGPGVDCVSFVQYWGSAGGSQVQSATRMLQGHYCATPGQTLTDDTVTTVLTGLVIKR